MLRERVPRIYLGTRHKQACPLHWARTKLAAGMKPLHQKATLSSSASGMQLEKFTAQDSLMNQVQPFLLRSVALIAT